MSHGFEIARGRLQNIVEHEMAVVACEPIISGVETVSQLYSGFVGSNQLNDYFEQNKNGLEGIRLKNGAGFMGSNLRFYLFSLARRSTVPGSIAFGYFRGLTKALRFLAKQMEIGTPPNVLETITLYYLAVYSEFDSDTKQLFVDDRSIKGAVSCFLSDIRNDWNDPGLLLPELDKKHIMNVAGKHVHLWIAFNQEEVLGELYEVVA